MTIEIQKEITRLHKLELLDGLLLDKTTGGKILWATDAYEKFGPAYARDAEITVDLITGENSGVIKTRAEKELEQQTARTRSVAEIYTPLETCRFMTDYLYDAWNRNLETYETDEREKEKAAEPKKNFIDTTILEITCGEAPFLVSRYDVTTGEEVPMKDRIGVLDRKLRLVNERTRTENSWMRSAVRAFQSTYGYELQGDSLLIARLNLLMTFEDYMLYRWDRKPTIDENKKIIDIISWNVWQMDGLSGTVPNGATPKAASDADQMSLFDIDEPKEKKKKQIYCKIKFWRENIVVEFASLGKGR